MVGACNGKCGGVRRGECQEEPKKFGMSHAVQNTLLVRFSRTTNKRFLYAENVTF